MKNRITNIFVASLLTVMLGSCGLYSKYETPTDVVEIDSLYSYIEASNDKNSIAELSWRELFTDTALQSLIEVALESNTNLEVARLNVVQSEVALKTARLSFLPTLNLNAQGGLSSFDGTTTKSYSIAAAASWEIDLFGRLRNAKEQSKAALQQSDVYRQAVQTELIASVANSYYTLLLLDRQLEISRQTLITWSENLRSMELLMRTGRVNKSSVLQSEASKIALEASVAALEEQIKVMENTISTLIGITPQQIQRNSFDETTLPVELSVGLPIELLSNRPDVRYAEFNLAQAFYATGEARSSLYPSLTLSGSAGYTDNGSSVGNPAGMLYSAIAQLVQPIFNSGALRASVKISEAQQQQAMLEFKQSLLDAGAEVNSALIEYNSARTQISYDIQQIEVLEAAVESSKLLMKSGSVTYLEVLTAQQSLLQGELSLANNHFDEICGVVELYRALGGGAE